MDTKRSTQRTNYTNYESESDYSIMATRRKVSVRNTQKEEVDNDHTISLLKDIHALDFFKADKPALRMSEILFSLARQTTPAAR